MIGDKKRVVVVVGPGRSGTSAITRGLQVLGVDLGNNLMPAVTGVNDKGFWEDQDIYNINLKVFEALGQDWHGLIALDISGVKSSVMQSLRSKAFEILTEKLKNTDCFGIKDPQMTRILPFWQGVFADLGLAVSYVIAFRNPNGVVPSLRRYTGFDDAKCVRLWFEYTLASLTHTSGADRLVVDYDLMMADPSIQLHRIARKLGFDFDVESDDFLAYRDDFLDDSLRHVRSDLTLEESRLASFPGIAPLFHFLKDAAADEREINSNEAIRFVENLADAYKQPAAQLKNALCELKNTRASLIESRSSFKSVAAELEVRTQTLEATGDALKLVTGELVEAREQLVQRTEVAEALHQELLACNDELATARVALSEITANFRKLSGDLDERIRELVENRALLAERTDVAESLNRNLILQSDELISVRADLAKRSAESEKITKDLMHRTSELVEVRALLTERTALAEKLGEQLTVRTEDLVSARRDLAEATSRSHELNVELSQKDERLKMLESDLEKKDFLLQQANAEIVTRSRGAF